jgi:riboflavin kinase, archaea type
MWKCINRMHPIYGIMVTPEDLECLKRIALMGGLSSPVFLKTSSLSTELGFSPQTASRRLRSMEQQQFINRVMGTEGQQVTITETGEDALRREYCDYYRLFGNREKRLSLPGTVQSGLGEGAYYMSLPQYTGQFESVLGFIPYPGTLNIRLQPGAILKRKRLLGAAWKTVKGFLSEGRTFGEVRCLTCFINDEICGIIVPGRTHYPEDLVEVVSPEALRKKFSLKDGDEVTIEVAI